MIIALPLDRCPKCRRKWRKAAIVCAKCAPYGRIVVAAKGDGRFPCGHYVRAHGRELWVCAMCEGRLDFFTRKGLRNLIDTTVAFRDMFDSMQMVFVNLAYFNYRKAEEETEKPRPEPIPFRR